MGSWGVPELRGDFGNRKIQADYKDSGADVLLVLVLRLQECLD
jgi:hypothetical protein